MNATIATRAADDTDFSPANLPYGVVVRDDGRVTIAVAIGEYAIDLGELQRAGRLPPTLPDRVFETESLRPFMALGRAAWDAVRARLLALVTDPDPDITASALLRRDTLSPMLPFPVGDYVDFYSSLAHATNMGRILRPDDEPLPENWRHVPVGYHGRSASIVVSGTPVARPNGPRRGDAGAVETGPTRRLDFELEVAFVVGRGNPLGTRIATRDAGEHIFGFVLLNDWSARDIQAFEYRPLGPFLGKSFATSISPWVVPVAALRPYFVAPPRQEPAVAPHLRCDEPWGIDLHLEVELRTATGAVATVTRTNFASMYWTAPQQLAHATVNGAAMRSGDLCASGTVSDDVPGSFGSLMETTWGGTRPVRLDDGSARTFLEDGDEVVLRGWCGGDGRPRVGFGEVRGRILPASPLG